MRKSLLSFTLIAGLFLPIAAIHAQSSPTVTATCKDGTAFTGTKRAGACRGHGGVQSWGEATSPANAPSEPTATTSQRTAPGPGGGAGKAGSIPSARSITAPVIAGMARPNTAATCQRRKRRPREPGRTTERLAPRRGLSERAATG
jgi:hypothetical protein